MDSAIDEKWWDMCNQDWDGPWDPSWDNLVWDGQDWVEPQQLALEETPKTSSVDTPSPSPSASAEPSVISPVEEIEAEDFSTFHGMFWDPIGFKNVELGPMITCENDDYGLLTACYQGDDGHSYRLIRLVNGLDQPPPEVTPAPTAPCPEQLRKITYAPVSKSAISEFTENAWPASGQPSSSGMTKKQGEYTPTTAQIEAERRIYTVEVNHKLWQGAKFNLEHGDKPYGNKDAFDVSTLCGMTLKEHITHVKWYDDVKRFKAKIHDDVPIQLWVEMCEIFKMWHIYNVDDPEIVLMILRNKWARESRG